MTFCECLTTENTYCACVDLIKIYCASLGIVKTFCAYIYPHMTNCASARLIRIPIEVQNCNLPVETITTIPYMPHVAPSLP